ncbi:MAG TPA: DNA-binding protein [Clostridiales bacterium]|nr:DNA-binding protein [Clostridiales bacterium]
MEENVKYIELFEIYGNLLTERQKELFTSHYLLDLSLSEIAEPENLSRQSVYDAVKKVKTKLDEYENALKLSEKFTAIKAVLKKVGGEAEKEITDILGR